MATYDPNGADIRVDATVGTLLNSFLRAYLYNGETRLFLQELTNQAIRVVSAPDTPEYTIPIATLQSAPTNRFVIRHVYDITGTGLVDFRAVSAFKQGTGPAQLEPCGADGIPAGSTVTQWIELEPVS